MIKKLPLPTILFGLMGLIYLIFLVFVLNFHNRIIINPIPPFSRPVSKAETVLYGSVVSFLFSFIYFFTQKKYLVNFPRWGALAHFFLSLPLKIIMIAADIMDYVMHDASVGKAGQDFIRIKVVFAAIVLIVLAFLASQIIAFVNLLSGLITGLLALINKRKNII